jgi:cytochrome c biogenesis protein CcmG, thiol:disulfide interchange protein DsbE
VTHVPAFGLSGGRGSLLMAAVFVLGSAWIFATRPVEGAMTGGAIPSPREGFAAPEVDLELLDGARVRLSDLRGQVVVLNVWASWCPPCRAEMPALEALHEQRAGQGVVVLGLNSTVQDSEQAARNFAVEYGLTFPIALDRDGEATRLYQVRALPSTFFVDRQGIIRRVVVGGPLNPSVLETTVLDLLGEGG